MSHSFIHESLNSSVDFPTYISWHTLSSDVTDKLKHGSVRITRSNKLEYTIHEENERGERAPLLESKEYLRSTELPALTRGVTWATAAFLLVNSALGAGVLNVPSAFEIGGGIFNTCLMQFLMIFLLSCTMLVLAYCSDVAKCDSYHDVLKSMCGRRAQQLSAFTIMLTCYGICITFLIIIGDQFDRIFASMVDPTFCEYWYMNRQTTITLVAFICVLPMCYFERLDFLKYASSLGIFAMIYPVLLTIYEYCMRGTAGIEFNTTGPSLMNYITVLPMISFAYQTHEVVVPVYACMANRNIWDFFKATLAAMGFLFVIYTIAGVFGYWTFGKLVPDDVMTSYEAKDPIVMIGNVALMIKMITTYPPIVVCGRGAVAGLYSELRGLTADQIMSGARSRLYFITTVWFLTSLILSITTPNIGVAIKLLGCLAFFNVFIFPGFCLRSLVQNKERDFGAKRIPMLIMAYFMIVMGFIVFFVVSGDEIRKIIHPEDKPKEALCESRNYTETSTIDTILTTLFNADLLATTPSYFDHHNSTLFNSTF